MSSLTSEARVKLELDAHGLAACLFLTCYAVLHNLLLHHLQCLWTSFVSSAAFCFNDGRHQKQLLSFTNS